MDFSILLGEFTPAQYIQYQILGLVGLVIIMFFEVKKRDKHSENTPYKFSFAWLLGDNAKRIGFTMLLIFIWVRCADLLVDIIGVNEWVKEHQFSALIFIGIGAFSDAISVRLKRTYRSIKKKISQETK